MPNSYFQFKQFRVEQDKAAMKVCTDACLFGAWTVDVVRSRESAVGRADRLEKRISRILDIGSGTGLLSLMLAQKLEGEIDAIEIDEAAYGQTTENFSTSPWKERLHAIHGDFRTMDSNLKYDLIITNPPFYEKDLRSPQREVNMARHDESLILEELVSKSYELLADEGLLSIMLPYHRQETLVKLAERQGLHMHAMLQVRQSPKHDFFRALVLFSKGREESAPPDERELTIKETDHKYSLPFIALLEDYYLSL